MIMTLDEFVTQLQALQAQGAGPLEVVFQPETCGCLPEVLVTTLSVGVAHRTQGKNAVLLGHE
jgi:hypothetical protein